QPEGSSDRCLDCKLKKTCAYSAVRIYQDRAKNGYFNWPISVVTDIEDFDVLTEKLRTGPYGRCVYDCDNDVCDNQVVNLQYKDGATASFTMAAFTKRICQR
uniref:Uncharacterized protein n=1 Tax=Ciona savignyi TaxID=51511 RepID=H2Y4P9_CIOSA